MRLPDWVEKVDREDEVVNDPPLTKDEIQDLIDRFGADVLPLILQGRVPEDWED